MIGEKTTTLETGKNRTLGCCVCSATPYSVLAVLYSSIALPPTSFRITEEENHEVLCMSKPSSKLKKLLLKVLRTNSMKNLFKSKKPRASSDVGRERRDLLSCLNSGRENANQRRDEKTRKDAKQVIANLRRQPAHSRLIASDYLEMNLDFIDQLITGAQRSTFFCFSGDAQFTNPNSNEEPCISTNQDADSFARKMSVPIKAFCSEGRCTRNPEKIEDVLCRMMANRAWTTC